MKINQHFYSLVPNYLFADVAKKTNAFMAAHPEKEVLRLGIGDVTLPLAPVVRPKKFSYLTALNPTAAISAISFRRIIPC